MKWNFYFHDEILTLQEQTIQEKQQKKTIRFWAYFTVCLIILDSTLLYLNFF